MSPSHASRVPAAVDHPNGTYRTQNPSRAETITITPAKVTIAS
jgi:hypothetical protein